MPMDLAMTIRRAIHVILFMTLCSHGVSVPAEQRYDPQRPPGKFVNLGLHRMYIDCRGIKSPTVLIDVGLGEASASWLPIIESLENETRVCLYDRAGYGFSDSGPGARTTAQITYELHALLELAQVPPPYVVVGHSFGGFTAQYFASLYPEETVGAVLVESSHPDQVTRLAALDKTGQRHKLVVSRRGPPPETMSEMEKKWFYLNSSRKATYAQMDELRYFSESAEQVSQAPPFPDIPLTVLTRGLSQLPEVNGKSMEAEWIDMQSDLATLSSQSWHIFVPDTGHNLHMDAPAVIVENIVNVVLRARQKMLETGKFSYHNAHKQNNSHQ